MKKLTTTAIALALMASSAFAAGIDNHKPKADPSELKAGECTGWENAPIISSFAETRDGKSCPATTFEKAVGVGLFFGTLAVGAHAASGGSFPIVIK